MSLSSLRGFYRHLLKLYPPLFRADFGEEIQVVFDQTLGSKQGWPALRLVLRELASAPHVLLSLHWREWRRRTWQSVLLPEDLPTRDGRHSWLLAGMEALFFLAWAGLLVLLTYADPDWLKPGWYRDPGTWGLLAAVLPLPILLLGLGRGLPRWVYPFYGMLLAHLCYAGLLYHLELILAAILLAMLGLVLVAAWVNAQRPLPDFVQRLGHSLRIDPLRGSFAVYGAAPLLLLWAYDDGFANDRSLYLLLSAAGMLLGALLYTRLKSPFSRLTALVAGLALATWPALLDRAARGGDVQPAEALPVLGLWALVVILLLIPPLLPGVSVPLTQFLKKGR
jgi:hypothetical protein